MEPEWISISEFGRAFGIRRTKTYALINQGELIVTKIGRRTLISVASARDLAQRFLKGGAS